MENLAASRVIQEMCEKLEERQRILVMALRSEVIKDKELNLRRMLEVAQKSISQSSKLSGTPKIILEAYGDLCNAKRHLELLYEDINAAGEKLAAARKKINKNNRETSHKDNR